MQYIMAYVKNKFDLWSQKLNLKKRKSYVGKVV